MGRPGGGSTDIGCHLLPENLGSRKTKEKGLHLAVSRGLSRCPWTVSQETDLTRLRSESSTYLELHIAKGEGEEGTAV